MELTRLREIADWLAAMNNPKTNGLGRSPYNDKWWAVAVQCIREHADYLERTWQNDYGVCIG